MSGKITIKDALSIWRNRAVRMARAEEHFSPPELYEILIQPTSSARRISALNHINRCPKCLHLAKDLTEAIAEAEAWDVALPKAAASNKIDWHGEIPTAGGKYSIEIKRRISDKSKGLITLYVKSQFPDALENKRVIVKDGRGRVLLDGIIFNGEVSQAIEDVDDIAPRFFVEPYESDNQ